MNGDELSGGCGKQISHIVRVRTGIMGLDEVLNGGIPAGALTLLSGGPGTGKTMLQAAGDHHTSDQSDRLKRTG